MNDGPIEDYLDNLFVELRRNDLAMPVRCCTKRRHTCATPPTKLFEPA